MKQLLITVSSYYLGKRNHFSLCRCISEFKNWVMNNIYIRCKRRKLDGTLDPLLFGNYTKELRNFNLKNFSRLLLNYAMVIENEIAWHVNGILSQFLI